MSYTVDIFNTGGIASYGIVLDLDGNIYVANVASSNISKLDPTGTILGIFDTSGSVSYGIAINATKKCIYTTNSSYTYAFKLDLNGTILNTFDVSGVSQGIAINSDGNIYITCTNNTICKCNSNGAIIDIFVVSGVSIGIAIDFNKNIYTVGKIDIGSDVYMVIYKLNSTGTIIWSTDIQINLSTDITYNIAVDSHGNSYTTISNNNVYKLDSGGTLVETFDISGSQLSGIVIDLNDNIYVANINGSIIKFDSLGTILETFDLSGSLPFGITLDSYGNIYATDPKNNTVIKITVAQVPPHPHPIPISNICFLAGTLIKTDQDTCCIEKINLNTHTINNKKIIAITKTVSSDKYLICFEKNSLGLNYPDKQTIMSKNHKIFYKGKIIEAYKFIGHFDVKRIKYSGEPLYNILMEEYSTINVHNLICETLHPENCIAKLYTSTIEKEYKNKIVVMLNDSIERKDHLAYKKIVNRIIN
jgi:streptogramin lyase